MYLEANIVNTAGDSIIVEKYLNLLLFALFITRLNANTVSIETNQSGKIKAGSNW